MAHKKGAGSSDNGRDSKPKFLGVKLFGGQAANAGSIIIRQRGTRFHVGENTYIGRDHTIHAKVDGHVYFTKHRGDKTSVSIRPIGYEEVIAAPVVKKAAAPKAAVAPKAVAAKPAAPKVEVKQAVRVETPVAVVAEPVVEAVVETPVVVAEPVVEAVVETPVAVVAEPVVEAKTVAALPKGIKQDDLKIVEGIGPKIESLLHDAGIKTWVELSETPVEKLKEILEAAGSRYQMHDPGTWPKQSQYAAEGKFDELKEWQDLLDGGKSAE